MSTSWAISMSNHFFLPCFNRHECPEMQHAFHSYSQEFIQWRRQATAEHVARGCPVGQTGPQTYGRLTFVCYSERRQQSGCLSWDMAVISPIIRMEVRLPGHVAVPDWSSTMPQFQKLTRNFNCGHSLEDTSSFALRKWFPLLVVVSTLSW